MAYLGKTPSQAVRSRYYYTAAGSETSLSGADDNNNTLIFTDGNYVDVYLNGVLLVSGTDYNTTTTNTIGGLSALAANDIVEIVVYDTFSVFGGEVKGDFNVTNGVLTADFEGTFTFKAKNTSGGSISKGTPVYISGHSGNNAEIGVADANDASKMPSFGIAAEAIGNNLTGKVVSYGNLKEIDTSAFAVGDELYVSNTGTLTATRPTGTSDKVQKVAKVIRSHASVGQLFVMGAGRTNDIPNSTGNNILFEDNAKAIFGAGSDLQIYHNGNDSVVRDAGTGDLLLAGSTNVKITTSGLGETMAEFATNGAATLYFDNAATLATTSSGIDVTGTVTAEASGANNSYITATGTGGSANLNLKGADDGFSSVFFRDTTGIRGRLQYDHTNETLRMDTNATQRFLIDSDGDISFYDSTGTTQGLFWDASGQSLGLGVTTNSHTLTIDGEVRIGAGDSGTSDMVLKAATSTGISVGGSTQAAIVTTNGTSSGSVHVGIEVPSNDSNDGFYVATDSDNDGVVDTLAMKINAAGNVGIGNTTPGSFYDGANQLVIGDGSGNKGISLYGGTSGVNRIYFADGASGAARYDGYLEYSHSNRRMLFGTAATTRMAISSTGDVGIGTNSPNAKLHVNVSTNRSLNVRTATDEAAGLGLACIDPVSGNLRDISVEGEEVHLSTGSYAGSSSTTRIKIDGSGNIFAKAEGSTNLRINLQQGSAKQWHTVDMTSNFVTDDSYNLSSLTDAGTGRVKTNINNDMNNALYSVTGFNSDGGGFNDYGGVYADRDATKTTGVFEYAAYLNGSYNDSDGGASNQIFGDLA